MLAWVWAAALLPAAMFGVAAWQSHANAWQQAQADIDHAVRIANEHAQRVMQTHELVFDRIDEELSGLSDAQIIDSHDQIRQQLLRTLQRVPALKTLSVWDNEGRQLVTSDEPPAKGSEVRAPDREFFRLATAEAGRTATRYTVAPDPSESTGQLLMMSRRREDRMGRFVGVVVASVRPSYFFDFYTELGRTEPGMSLSLFDQSGRIITRMPAPELPVQRAPMTGHMMQRIAAGENAAMLTITSPVDQQRRLIAYRRIDDTPLYTAAGKANEVILAEWRSTLWLLAAFIVPMAGALAYVAAIARRRTQREVQALRRLNKEADKRLKIEAALRQSQKLEAMGHLTGGVAHDVNNLLMVVNNNAHLLERMRPGMDTTPAINSIKRAVEAGTRLTRQLLAFSRRQAWRAEVIDLRRWLPSVTDLLRHTLTQSIRIEHEVAHDIRMVSVDAAELELALINLAINARDAMPEGGALRILVRNAGKEDVSLDGEFVEIRVSDEGVGIPPELLERVFEPFFTTKEIGKGTGLGLSQVYGFCKQAGGVAVIHSSPGSGTAVSMFLLAAPEASAPPPPPSTALPEGDGHVLLVEDNDDVAAATAALLERLGYRITRASSAPQALALIDSSEEPFDGVLSDIVMAGGMDGIELALALRQSRPELPVVLMTGYTSRLEAAIAAGLTVIAKPCQPAELAGALARAM
ncbi:hybrid sensor histidine kinase/response regulator [Piscinibacter terrae]|nr:ATP-binding protein [Albitalea terrae]